jgi:hypothetical protein
MCFILSHILLFNVIITYIFYYVLFLFIEDRFIVSIRTYSERLQRSTQEPKRDPSKPEGTARTLQAADQRLAVRSQRPNTA